MEQPGDHHAPTGSYAGDAALDPAASAGRLDHDIGVAHLRIDASETLDGRSLVGVAGLDDRGDPERPQAGNDRQPDRTAADHANGHPRRDSALTHRVERDDPYFLALRDGWSAGLRKVFDDLPNEPWFEA